MYKPMASNEDSSDSFKTTASSNSSQTVKQPKKRSKPQPEKPDVTEDHTNSNPSTVTTTTAPANSNNTANFISNMNSFISYQQNQNLSILKHPNQQQYSTTILHANANQYTVQPAANTIMCKDENLKKMLALPESDLIINKTNTSNPNSTSGSQNNLHFLNSNSNSNSMDSCSNSSSQLLKKSILPKSIIILSSDQQLHQQSQQQANETSTFVTSQSLNKFLQLDGTVDDDELVNGNTGPSFAPSFAPPITETVQNGSVAKNVLVINHDKEKEAISQNGAVVLPLVPIGQPLDKTAPKLNGENTLLKALLQTAPKNIVQPVPLTNGIVENSVTSVINNVSGLNGNEVKHVVESNPAPVLTQVTSLQESIDAVSGLRYLILLLNSNLS